MTPDGEDMVRAGGQAPPAQIRVWDLFVRCFHWSLVAGITVSWPAAEEWDRLHEWSGYLAVGLVAARIVWGFIGSKHARFSDFLALPRAVIIYLGDSLRGPEARHLGHNPPAAW